MSRASRALDVATGLSVGGLLGCGAILFYPPNWLLSVIVIGLSLLGGLIGYFWQTHFSL